MLEWSETDELKTLVFNSELDIVEVDESIDRSGLMENSDFDCSDSNPEHYKFRSALVEHYTYRKSLPSNHPDAIKWAKRKRYLQ